MKGNFLFLEKDLLILTKYRQKKHKHHKPEMRADGIQYEMMYSFRMSLHLQPIFLVSEPYFLVLLC